MPRLLGHRHLTIDERINCYWWIAVQFGNFRDEYGEAVVTPPLLSRWQAIDLGKKLANLPCVRNVRAWCGGPNGRVVVEWLGRGEIEAQEYAKSLDDAEDRHYRQDLLERGYIPF